jgi:ATP-binding cassette subfamily C exporter for protease/lipase
VLDEPNSNLDDAGEQALVAALLDLRSRGKTIILITHRTSVLGVTNKLLLVQDGSPQMFGPSQQVLMALAQAQQQQQQQAQQAQLAAQQQAQQQAAAQAEAANAEAPAATAEQE